MIAMEKDIRREWTVNLKKLRRIEKHFIVAQIVIRVNNS